jgi:hypothetical protein
MRASRRAGIARDAVNARSCRRLRLGRCALHQRLHGHGGAVPVKQLHHRRGEALCLGACVKVVAANAGCCQPGQRVPQDALHVTAGPQRQSVRRGCLLLRLWRLVLSVTRAPVSLLPPAIRVSDFWLKEAHAISARDPPGGPRSSPSPTEHVVSDTYLGVVRRLTSAALLTDGQGGIRENYFDEGEGAAAAPAAAGYGYREVEQPAGTSQVVFSRGPKRCGARLRSPPVCACRYGLAQAMVDAAAAPSMGVLW